jgi:dihydrolipoamide dehydrogenase
VQTTIVDATGLLGGVCLHAGCIPSKTLLHVAEIMEQARDAERFGVTMGEPKFDLQKIREWKEGVITALATGLDKEARRLKIKRIKGRAQFKDSNVVGVSGGEVGDIRFRRAIVASGSTSIRLRGIEVDSPRVIHSGGALELKDVPKTMLVVGGGYIGLELGSVYAALGSEVTVVEMLASLLPGADADLVRPLTRRMKSLLTEVCLKTKVAAMKETAEGIEVTFDGDNPPKRQVYDTVFVAVGRRPNSADLGLENTGAKVSEQGFIEVDEQFRTGDSSIYAIGDVAPGLMLAHKASAEGKVCAEIIAGHDVAFTAKAIPAVVFTDPEIAWCGLTETEAKAQGAKVAVKKLFWGSSGRATAIGRMEGLTKILFEPETQRVLGVAMCGPHAGEMIAEGVLAVQMGATAADLAATVHPHPTLSEMVGEAADLMVMASRSRH